MVSIAGSVAKLTADYRTLAGAKIRSDWEYRLSFGIHSFAALLVTAMDFAGIAVLFSNTDTLGEWTLTQVAFLYGVSGICFGLGDLLVGPVETISTKVRDGSFDVLLIRPMSTIVNLTGSEFTLRRLGRIIQAAVVFSVALVANDIDWTVDRVALIGVMLVSGTVIASSIWVITSSIAFWTTTTQEMANTFTYGGNTAISYPLQVFEQWLRVLLAYVVPLVFVNYLPALYILDLPTPLGLPPTLAWAAPAVAVALATLAGFVWGQGLRHYRSTGS